MKFFCCSIMFIFFVQVIVIFRLHSRSQILNLGIRQNFQGKRCMRKSTTRLTGGQTAGDLTGKSVFGNWSAADQGATLQFCFCLVPLSRPGCSRGHPHHLPRLLPWLHSPPYFISCPAVLWAAAKPHVFYNLLVILMQIWEEANSTFI